jgi:hypothetical protein
MFKGKTRFHVMFLKSAFISRYGNKIIYFFLKSAALAVAEPGFMLLPAI